MRTILLNLRYERLSSLSLLVALLLGLVSVAEASAPRASGRIDYFIGVALKDAGLKPSRSASDAEFLRRVYLDLTGHPPTPDEALKFIQSGRRNKRAQFIDALVGIEDYLDHWTIYWSNLLVTRTPSGQDNRRAFETWIRRSLQVNRSYHEFVT